jgi:hypothetical protein
MRRPQTPVLKGHEKSYIEIARSPISARSACAACGETVLLKAGEFFVFVNGSPQCDEHFGEPYRSQLADARRKSTKLSRPPAIGARNLELKAEHFRR